MAPSQVERTGLQDTTTKVQVCAEIVTLVLWLLCIGQNVKLPIFAPPGKSPRREVVRSSAGMYVVYPPPPFLVFST